MTVHYNGAFAGWGAGTLGRAVLYQPGKSRWTGQHRPASICALDQPLKNKCGILLPNALLHTLVFSIISPYILLLCDLESLVPDQSSLLQPTHTLLLQALD